MVKNYIVDTGILLVSPHAIQNFDEHNVLITAATLEALGEIGGTSGERGANARKGPAVYRGGPRERIPSFRRRFPADCTAQGGCVHPLETEEFRK